MKRVVWQPKFIAPQYLQDLFIMPMKERKKGKLVQEKSGKPHEDFFYLVVRRR